jgi:hypothetical protein
VLHKKLSNIDGHFREDVHQVLHVYNFVLVMKKDIRIDSKKKIVPKFTVVDIQMDVSDAEFKKGMALFKGGKVKMLTFDIRGFNAVVSGTHDYSVSVSESHFDRGECSCYLGQNDIYCKHMIALAIAAVFFLQIKRRFSSFCPTRASGMQWCSAGCKKRGAAKYSKRSQ